MNEYFDFFTINFPGHQTFRTTFGTRNFTSQYFCFAVPASITSIFIAKKQASRNIFLILFILITLTSIILRQRAAWLGILVSIIIFITINRKYIIVNIKSLVNKKSIVFASIFIIILLVTINTSNINLGDKIYDKKKTIWSTFSSSLKTDSNWGGRLNMYKSSLDMAKDNPIFGIGLKNWRLLYPGYADNSISYQYIRDYKFGQIRQRPHNDFFWFLAEIGILGIIFILWYIFYHLKLSYKEVIKSERPSRRYINAFCMVSIIAIMIESMFDFPSERTIPNLYFWSIFGYISIQNKEGSLISSNLFLRSFTVITLLVVSIFSFFDIKSNYYSQKANYFNYHNKSDEALYNSHIALDYFRNLDSAGTPLFYYIAIAKYLKGDKESAMESFSKSLKISPYHVGTMINYMILLGEKQNLDEAYGMMLKIKKIYPHMAKPQLDMAKFYIQSGMNNRAEEILLDLKEKKLDDQDKTRDNLLEIIETN